MHPSAESPPPLKPVDPASRLPRVRIEVMDALRGFAILGILILNIHSFGREESALFNPAAHGDFYGINWIVWHLSHIFAEGKFVSLFSILFGASVILFLERVEAKGIKPAGMYYRRVFALIALGMLHAYLLWHGDILVAYGICAIPLFLIRRWHARTLFLIGLVLLCVPSIIYSLFQWSLPYWGEEGRDYIRLAWTPDQEYIDYINETYRGNWIQQMDERIYASFTMQTFVFAIFVGWKAAGLMLLGIAFYRWKILSAERSNRFYISLGTICLSIGFALTIFGVYQNTVNEWRWDYSFFIGSQFNSWGSIFVSIGYLCCFMLAWRKKWLTKALLALSKVGRLSLTNYIMQTLICTSIFYGHGLGLFGIFPRYGLALTVLPIWIAQIAFSQWWLKHFIHGPAGVDLAQLHLSQNSAHTNQTRKHRALTKDLCRNHGYRRTIRSSQRSHQIAQN